MTNPNPFVLTAGYDLIVTMTPIWKDQVTPHLRNITVANSQVNRIVVTHDNKVALASNPYVLIYDIFSSSGKATQYTGHITNVTDMCFYQNIFYSCSEDRSWQFWDRTQSLTRAVKKIPTTSALNSMALSPNGNYLFTANEKGQVEMWDTSTFKSITSIKLSQLPVRSISLSSDGTKLVAACQDGNAFVLNVTSEGLTELNKFKAHTDVIIQCAISPDQQTFVTTSADSTAKLWDLNSCELKYTLAEQNQKKWVWDAAYTNDSKFVVTGGTDKAYRTWDVQTGSMVFKNDSSHSKGITALAIFNPQK
ncbi:WD repeat-containing protein wat1 [Tritrichomonas foetus]|uniref:WD repeat-containing protein wat1 n=1 Tax=Tritrichomonas foetus TaxID=1144522 RepID=A0A1J4JVN1_9EUKA|nr:WD repeat-containing protein wat1 [Tritrichomonas foetus]|eukprot:OHT01341.1 WD repeat-containing protein wat1 [Tritrichomonas foetus]